MLQHLSTPISAAAAAAMSQTHRSFLMFSVMLVLLTANKPATISLKFHHVKIVNTSHNYIHQKVSIYIICGDGTLDNAAWIALCHYWAKVVLWKQSWQTLSEKKNGYVAITITITLHFQTSSKDTLLPVSLSCHIASIHQRALILFIQTLALYKSFTYLLTYLLTYLQVRYSSINVSASAITHGTTAALTTIEQWRTATGESE